MSPDYQRLRGVADKLYYRFKDVTDDHNETNSVAGDVRNVVEDFEASKQPRSIEDRVKRVIEGLKELRRSGSEAIDFSDIDELIDQYEDLRSEIRSLDNY